MRSERVYVYAEHAKVNLPFMQKYMLAVEGLSKIMAVLMKAFFETSMPKHSQEDGAGGANARDPYKILGLEIGADVSQVKKAFRTLARVNHPDKNIGNEDEATRKMSDLNWAYETITKQHHAKNIPETEQPEATQESEDEDSDDTRRTKMRAEVRQQREFFKLFSKMKKQKKKQDLKLNKAHRAQKQMTREYLRNMGVVEAPRPGQETHMPNPPAEEKVAGEKVAENRADAHAEDDGRAVFIQCRHKTSKAIALNLDLSFVEIMRQKRNWLLRLDENGNTCMHYCAYFGRAALLEVIMTLCLDNWESLVLTKNNLGQTPCDVARTIGIARQTEDGEILIIRLTNLQKMAEDARKRRSLRARCFSCIGRIRDTNWKLALKINFIFGLTLLRFAAYCYLYQAYPFQVLPHVSNWLAFPLIGASKMFYGNIIVWGLYLCGVGNVLIWGLFNGFYIPVAGEGWLCRWLSWLCYIFLIFLNFRRVRFIMWHVMTYAYIVLHLVMFGVVFEGSQKWLMEKPPFQLAQQWGMSTKEAMLLTGGCMLAVLDWVLHSMIAAWAYGLKAQETEKQEEAAMGSLDQKYANKNKKKKKTPEAPKPMGRAKKSRIKTPGGFSSLPKVPFKAPPPQSLKVPHYTSPEPSNNDDAWDDWEPSKDPALKVMHESILNHEGVLGSTEIPTSGHEFLLRPAPNYVLFAMALPLCFFLYRIFRRLREDQRDDWVDEANNKTKKKNEKEKGADVGRKAKRRNRRLQKERERRERERKDEKEAAKQAALNKVREEEQKIEREEEQKIEREEEEARKRNKIKAEREKERMEMKKADEKEEKERKRTEEAKRQKEREAREARQAALDVARKKLEAARVALRKAEEERKEKEEREKREQKERERKSKKEAEAESRAKAAQRKRRKDQERKGQSRACEREKQGMEPPPGYPHDEQPPPYSASSPPAAAASPPSPSIQLVLQSLGLAAHLSLFKQQEIDHEALLLMREQHLGSLGLSLGARLKLLKYIQRTTSATRVNSR